MRKLFKYCWTLVFVATISCVKEKPLDPNSSGPLSIDLTRDVFASYVKGFSFIKADGTLWTFGSKELTGREPSVTTDVPQQVGTDKDWVSVHTGYATFALKGDGTLWSWGAPNLIGRTGNNLIPAKVNEDKDWASVHVSGNSFTLAIKKDGSLWGCGKGTNTSPYAIQGVSYFLSPTLEDRPLMSRIDTPADCQKIASFGALIFLIKKDGSVWGWGNPNKDIFGTYDTKTKLVPLLPGNDWSDVACGIFNAIALKKDGSIWAWGKVDSQETSPQKPVRIGNDNDWVKIISAVSGSNAIMFALKKDGTLWHVHPGSKSTNHNPGDRYENIFEIGYGIVAKKAGKDEYCAHDMYGADLDFIHVYGGKIFLDPGNKMKCVGF